GYFGDMRLRRDFLRSVEAGVIGLLLIQAIRYLYGTLYAHLNSADLVRRVADPTALVNIYGYVEPSTVERELLAVSIALLTPLLAIMLARTLWSIPLAVAVAVIGRTMALQVPDSAPLAAALVVGAGLLYMVLIVIRRPAHFPSMLLLGITLDILIRALNDTRDLTWEPARIVFFNIPNDQFFLGMAVIVLILTSYSTLTEVEIQRLEESSPVRGTLSGWGSFALGAFFFIELTLLGLPNAVARWSNTNYAAAVPLILVATLLPLIPSVRVRARSFLGAFDGVWRGWLWALLLGLLFILGYRFDGYLALGVLVLAQFITGLTLWWMMKPATSGLPNPTPILALISIVIFALLSAGDYFTYDYAYVRDFAPPFDLLEEVLRSLKDFGLPLFLLATLIVCMPMILERRVIPWRDGRGVESFLTILLTIAIGIGGANLAAIPVVRRPDNLDCLRVGSLNIHSGYTLLYGQNLDLLKETLSVRPNNTDVDLDIILLQEVDTGRLSSFGVDQVEWLARQLRMEATFFPQNEFLQGLAILSRIPIREMRGKLLTSSGPQGAVMMVELSLDENPFYVYNVWLGYEAVDENGQPLPPELQDQVIQTNELEQIIVNNHSPDFDDRIVLGGTFNYDRNTPLYN
ncbi:MAG: hypothetical protein CUN55_14725, partial [Phototrophicales bacterium]